MELSARLLSAIETANRPVVLFDIDGVLLDNSDRLQHLTYTDEHDITRQQDKPDWEAWHNNSHLDKAGAFVRLFNTLKLALFPVLVTARIDFQDGTRASLLRVLQRAGITIPDCQLLMREKGEADGAAYKYRVACAFVARKVDVLLAIDDDARNCDQFMDAGLPTLRAWNHLPTSARLDVGRCVSVEGGHLLRNKG